jgi:hypothetical protein
MASMIDTLQTARTFEAACFAKPQAESLASAIPEAASVSREDLATKDFVRIEIATVRADLANVRNDLIRWVIGSQVALVVFLVALSNFTRAFN